MIVNGMAKAKKYHRCGEVVSVGTPSMSVPMSKNTMLKIAWLMWSAKWIYEWKLEAVADETHGDKRSWEEAYRLSGNATGWP